MLKQLFMALLCLGMVFNVQAFEKTKVNLDQDFWGTWSVYDARTKCKEVYTFTKPSHFIYQVKNKKLTGNFAIVRSSDAAKLDMLIMKVQTDNQLAGCLGNVVDYTNVDIRLTLKWVTNKAAEFCTDIDGKQCINLFFIKE